jgi:hypothetical protein
MGDFFYLSVVKDLSKYIESILDGEIRGLNVTKGGDTYIITITKKNFLYQQSDKSFITLSDSITIRRNLEIYFPNDDIKFEIKHIFV